MKLSLKQTAALITVGAFLGGSLAAVGVWVILTNVSLSTLADGAMFGLITYFVYLFYQITLSRLEYNEKLKEMTEKKD